MQFVLATVLLFVACATAADVEMGYHQKVGIPLAKKIKAAEDILLAKRRRSGRIIGGEEVEPTDHPYFAGLLINFEEDVGTSVCGAALVSRTSLLTAARCWFDGQLQASRLTVVLAADMLFSGGHRVTPREVTTHPDWNPLTLQNDIATISLYSPVPLTDRIQPIALPTNFLDETFAAEWATAVGYGKTSDDQVGVSVFAVARHVNLQVITTEECQAVYGTWAQDSNICTDGTGGVGICSGDIGGPLVATRDDERILVGVGSFVASTGCESGYPSAFSRITSFNDFISENL